MRLIQYTVVTAVLLLSSLPSALAQPAASRIQPLGCGPRRWPRLAASRGLRLGDCIFA